MTLREIGEAEYSADQGVSAPTQPGDAVALLRDYPNLQAMMDGCVSGRFTEWPQMRVELAKLLSALSSAKSAGAQEQRFRGLTPKEAIAAVKAAQRGEPVAWRQWDNEHGWWIFYQGNPEYPDAEPLYAAASAKAGEWTAVEEELERAVRKFPTWPTDPLHALAVLGEEFGELTKEVLQLTYEPHKSTLADVRTEAIQTAAMALRFAKSLDAYEYKRGEQHQQAAAASEQRGG